MNKLQCLFYFRKMLFSYSIWTFHFNHVLLLIINCKIIVVDLLEYLMRCLGIYYILLSVVLLLYSENAVPMPYAKYMLYSKSWLIIINKAMVVVVKTMKD